MRARRHPDWLKVNLFPGAHYDRVNNLLKDFGLNTVCQAAKCPNLGECYGRGAATFMILGNVCTRNCRYCNVNHGNPLPLDRDEPVRVAEAVNALELKYVVVTSVTRDDLEDGGAGHFCRTVEEIRALTPKAGVEILTPDFRGEIRLLEKVLSAEPHVFNHNVETVREIYPRARPQGDFERALRVLKTSKRLHPEIVTKSGLMAGLGETRGQMLDAFQQLRDSQVDILTIGQYLQPRKDLLPVERYYHPDEFKELEGIALDMGFRRVFAGPLVRSSYHAETVRG